MKQTITETKIRSIVRKELQSYLIQEGLWDDIKAAPTAITKDVVGHIKKSIQNVGTSWGKDFGFSEKSTEQYTEISTILKKVNVSAEPLKNAYIIYTKNKENKFMYASEIQQRVIVFAIEKVDKIHNTLKPLFKYVENEKVEALKEAENNETNAQREFGTPIITNKTPQEILADYVKKIEAIKAGVTEKKEYLLTENNQVGALTLDIVIFSADFAGRLLGTNLFPAHVKVAKEFFSQITQHLELLKSAEAPAEPAEASTT